MRKVTACPIMSSRESCFTRVVQAGSQRVSGRAITHLQTSSSTDADVMVLVNSVQNSVKLCLLKVADLHA